MNRQFPAFARQASLKPLLSALCLMNPVLAIADFAIVDTGQTLCYDHSAVIACPTEGQAFYGQDAQQAGNQPHYTLNADGLTVQDHVTGLIWQHSPDANGDGRIDADDKFTLAEAEQYAEMLNVQGFGGYSDWRLPTLKELYSLIDFRGTDPSGDMSSDGSDLTPFLNTAYFAFGYGDVSAGERIIDAQYATQTRYVSTTMNGSATMFGVNFADGRIKGYPVTGKTYYALYVRGTAYGDNQFIAHGDGTVSDQATGLMWTQADSGVGMNWEAALAWANAQNAANYLGYSDWRLPNAKELQGLVDYTRSPATTSSAALDPAFDATAITNEAGQADYPFYWTGTTFTDTTGQGQAAVYVAFGRALGYMNGAWIDVHGAGAQRSDPKSGDPADYPYGRGPQGDAIRINNYVRLVRGTAGGVDSAVTADLAITQASSASSVRVGSRVTYTLTVKNNGPDSADRVAMTATWPSGIAFIAASPGCVRSGASLTCSVSPLASGATAVARFTVRPIQAGVFTTTAQVSSATFDTNSANNTATLAITVQSR